MALVAKVDLDGNVTYVEEDLPSTPAPEVVPYVVTRRQARRALLQAGLLSQVDAVIDAIIDAETREAMRIDWQDATEFKRDNPTLISLASALNLTDAQLDQLFIDASKI